MLIEIEIKIYDGKYFIWNGFVTGFFGGFFFFNFNQTAQKYLNRAGQNLLTCSERQRILWHFVGM